MNQTYSVKWEDQSIQRKCNEENTLLWLGILSVLCYISLWQHAIV